ncbi:MAG: slipin family protein [Candidatus Obscuribacterales bacterium]|nr:slipin family protein [Candidatus Obscuribacterales bacterium]
MLGVVIGLFLFFVFWLAVLSLRRITVFEYERGLLYSNGQFSRVLEPGLHKVFGFGKTVKTVDMRAVMLTIAGQEVLTGDNVGLKVSLAVNYRVSDPVKAMNSLQSYATTLHTIAQIALRDTVGSLNVDDLLKNRSGLGKEMLSKVAPVAQRHGLVVDMVEIKDVIFPTELRKIFAEVIKAQKEGLAALERARGETASLRNLANAAKLMEDNPALLNLRMLQSVAQGNATVVLGSTNGLVATSAKHQGKDSTEK